MSPTSQAARSSSEAWLRDCETRLAPRLRTPLGTMGEPVAGPGAVAAWLEVLPGQGMRAWDGEARAVPGGRLALAGQRSLLCQVLSRQAAVLLQLERTGQPGEGGR